MRYKTSLNHCGASPDMTPTLDIVFIMLIFFIVTSSFIKESGITPNIPKTQTGPKAPTTPIAFRISADNNIFYEGRLVDPWMTEAIIKEESTARPEAPVVIAANENSHTGLLVRLHDQASKAGMANDRIAVQVE
ncbi:ExbD/TolR family protein [Kordiimonas aestuarii]|uniref:ExbD/TolR family protein n=1 Tax=Kordiimonas aestuarii TaxID=1005925 RepID=UPI0021D373F3|nr:biopolymer transporter ExbD [Kordiimonas aestuarii]